MSLPPRRRALEVREDLRNDLGLLDARDDPERAAAALAGVDLDAEHALSRRQDAMRAQDFHADAAPEHAG